MEGMTTAVTAVTTALTSGFSDVATGMLDLIASVLPIGLPVLGAILTIKFGKKAFKTVTNG